MKQTSKISIKRIAIYCALFIFTAFAIFIGMNWNKFYKIQEVSIREINCSEKTVLLEDVIKSDQRVRNENVPFKEMFDTDHKNLETVVSILEHCGMPTLQDVDPIHIRAIWAALQHAHDKKHTKKYFPLLKAAMENGDLSKEHFATMKDRLLMHEGKPQIYGTQIKDRKLYTLDNPESVNSRRASMGMRPIEEYLKDNFNIEFDVVQEK